MPHDLIVCVFNEAGEVITSNDQHAFMLGRESRQILGRNWREWTAPGHLSASERTFERCLAGEPVCHTRHIDRPDGTVAIGRSQLFSLRQVGGTIVIGTMQFLLVTTDIVKANALEIAEYVGNLSGEMAKMAEGSGLKQLGLSLENVAQEAGEIVALLNGSDRRRH